MGIFHYEVLSVPGESRVKGHERCMHLQHCKQAYVGIYRAYQVDGHPVVWLNARIQQVSGKAVGPLVKLFIGYLPFARYYCSSMLVGPTALLEQMM